MRYEISFHWIRFNIEDGDSKCHIATEFDDDNISKNELKNLIDDLTFIYSRMEPQA